MTNYFKHNNLPENQRLISLSYPDLFLCLAVTVILSSISITRQSLWIDESTIAWLSSHTTFKELLITQFYHSGSESQMPLYVWYTWCWSKLFGISEIALRLSNFPFAFIFLLTMQVGVRTILKYRWLWLMAAVCPFVWFYMNECRPYVAVMAFSTLSFVCLISYIDNIDAPRKFQPWFCLLGLFLASGMLMLSVFLIPAFLMLLFFKYKTDILKWKFFIQDWFWPVLISLPFLLFLGGWFLWTLWHGYGGARQSPTLLNFLFALYEFSGFQGLGPPRNVIRYHPTWNTFSQIFYLIPLSIGSMVWCAVILSAYLNVRHKSVPCSILPLFYMFSLGVLLFYLSAVLFDFRFWGRHLTPFFPVFLFILIALSGNVSHNYPGTALRKIALFSLTFIWLCSSVRLVLLDEYKKDDYRSAVNSVSMIAGSTGTILWAADVLSGSYYGLRFPIERAPKLFWHTDTPAIPVSNLTEQQLESAIRKNSHPIVIALSKPDLFDRHNAVENIVKKFKGDLIKSHNAFSIYKIT